ncbi:MAG: hypothetical protein N5P05_002230 [Chroococcopsis gigantea SAG 12.99]|jgi:hypothetical protein|nr:hypothetical protein [Chroococcopsis gigantea SAG 12.99]
MIKTLLTTACVSLGLSLMGTAPTLAGGFYIDNFNSSASQGAYGAPYSIQAFEPPQRVLTTTGFNSDSRQMSGLDTKGTLGGTRNLNLNVNSTAGAPADTVVTARADVISNGASGIFNFTANKGVQATTTLTYSDLFSEQNKFFQTASDKSALAVNIVSLTSKDASFNFTLMDRGGAMSTVSLTKADYERSNGRLVVLLSQFTGININDIVAAELSVSQTADVNSAGNIQIDSISGLEIPEPSVVLASMITAATALLLKRRQYQSK